MQIFWSEISNSSEHWALKEFIDNNILIIEYRTTFPYFPSNDYPPQNVDE